MSSWHILSSIRVKLKHKSIGGAGLLTKCVSGVYLQTEFYLGVFSARISKFLTECGVSEQIRAETHFCSYVGWEYDKPTVNRQPGFLREDT